MQRKRNAVVGMSEVEEVEVEEILIEKIEKPQIIETGDSIKVKQVLDDALMDIVKNPRCGYIHNHYWENIKLSIMAAACIFALLAQFYPLPFPASRPLLGVCCAMYFILSGVLQGLVTFIDKDCILILKGKTGGPGPCRIRTRFPRFQETYTFIIEDIADPKKSTEAAMYVGRYFTERGEFDEARFTDDVISHFIDKYEKSIYNTIIYDHSGVKEKAEKTEKSEKKIKSE